MAKIITERFVRRSIIAFLARKGWDRGLREKETAEHGIDIKVRHNKYARYFFIETKGESSSKSAKSVSEVAFIYSLGQIITRMKAGNARYYYGLGLPESSARIAVRRIPWLSMYPGLDRIALDLEFEFAADTNNRLIKVTYPYASIWCPPAELNEGFPITDPQTGYGAK